MAKDTSMTKKDKKELQKSAEQVSREIAEKFAQLFSEKVDEIVQQFSQHLDDHMDEMEGLIEEGFDSLHEHLQVLQRVEKLEKKLDEIEMTGKGKRFVV